MPAQDRNRELTEAGTTSPTDLVTSGDVVSDVDGGGAAIGNNRINEIDYTDRDGVLVTGAVIPVAGGTFTTQYGTLTIARDGTYTYTLDDSLTEVNELDDGDELEESIVYYRDENDNGLEDTPGEIYVGSGTLTISVNGNNDAPVAIDDTASVDESTTDDAVASDSIDVLDNDTDVDGDTLQLVSFGQGASGTVTRDDNGTPGNLTDDTLIYTPTDPDFTGTDTFTYVVSDGSVTDTGTVTVTVVSQNDDPEADPIVEGPIDEDDAPLTGNLITDANATDVDGDTLEVDTDSVEVTTDEGREDLDITVAEDGTYSFDPSQFNDLDDGESEEVTVTYDIVDGEGGVTTNTLTFVVEGENDAPTADDVDATVSEDGPAIPITADAEDVDGDDLDYFLDDTGTVGEVTNNGDGTFTYDPNGQFENLAEGETFIDTFTYVVNDGDQTSAPATVEVTVVGENDAPELNDDEDSETSGTENQVITGQLLAGSDVDGDDLEFEIVPGSVQRNGTTITVPFVVEVR
jgi:VCBS repeat-containing protein